MTASRKALFVSFALCLAAPLVGRTQLFSARKMEPEVLVRVRAEISGDVSISAWSRTAGLEVAPVLPRIVHCEGGAKPDGAEPNRIVCANALHHNGSALEAVVDPAPIARSLDPSTTVELWLDSPRLGFDSWSTAMEEENGGDTRSIRSIRFQAGAPPPPIRMRFGYRPDQLPGIYLPLVALALAMMLIAVLMSRAGLSALSRSAVLLGTIVWMGAASQLQADRAIEVLLFGNPFANLVALLADFWPPLVGIAIGVAFGSRMRADAARGGKAGEVFASLAVIPLLLTCAVGALPSMSGRNWIIAATWLAAAPIILILRRSWVRTTHRSRITQLGAGELRERIAALAARAGCPKVKIFVAFSARSETANAFALPGRSIFLTAHLVRSLSKREVDAVAAHELSHFRHSSRAVWMSLCLSMLFCETPVRDLLLSWPGGLCAAMLLPILIFFVSLHGMRKREFFADAGAAALTGDPRAMISSLARIARNNGALPMNAFAEWFSSHPSMPRRIRALAAAARLDPAEVESLCSRDDAGERYELPQEAAESGTVFTPAWQKMNAGVYGWVVIFSSSGAGLFVASLLNRWAGTRFGGFGIAQVLAGIAFGCIATKALAAASMSANYARVRRKLVARLGIGGRLVGIAIDSEPRLYNGFRFSDAGFLRFDSGRLCYKSERVSIALNPADVVEVAMVAASPSMWVRQAPMVRFRRPESGVIQAFILHPVDWLPAQRCLLKSIERWKAAQSSPQSTSIEGLDPIAGQPFVNPTPAEMVRGFLVPGCVTLLASISMSFSLGAGWWYAGCALAVAACSHVFMFLPAMLYRRPVLASGLTAPADAN